MRFIWQSKNHIKNLATPLNWIVYLERVEIFSKRFCGPLKVNWLQSLKLSKMEVWKRFCHNLGLTWAEQHNFFKPPTLTACNFAASWPTETQSTSLERYKPSKNRNLNFEDFQDFSYKFCSVKVTSFSWGLFSKGAIFISDNCTKRGYSFSQTLRTTTQKDTCVSFLKIWEKILEE